MVVFRSSDDDAIRLQDFLVQLLHSSAVRLVITLIEQRDVLDFQNLQVEQVAELLFDVFQQDAVI
ncbi:hypothetical protein SDC9_157997 [bioreactor metagenome]|uniref:Uncharacterized protein n=1 Tax=bioreactor metagenome TaxID=1076179 RepID=A0A645F9X2_9ZZZZ